MTPEIDKKLEELRLLCKSELSNKATIALFDLTAYGWQISITERTPEDLIREGVSMKNIKGDWIK